MSEDGTVKPVNTVNAIAEKANKVNLSFEFVVIDFNGTAKIQFTPFT